MPAEFNRAGRGLELGNTDSGM